MIRPSHGHYCSCAAAWPGSRTPPNGFPRVLNPCNKRFGSLKWNRHATLPAGHHDVVQCRQEPGVHVGFRERITEYSESEGFFNLGVRPIIRSAAFRPHERVLLFFLLPSSRVSVSQAWSSSRSVFFVLCVCSFLDSRGGELDSRPVPRRRISHCHRPFLPSSSTHSITPTAGPSHPPT